MGHPAVNAEEFAAIITDGIDEDRAAAESLMLDSCIVERKTGRASQNESTGAEEPTYAVTFPTKCRIRDQGYADSGADVGGRLEVIGTTIVSMPWNVPDVQQDDRITITGIGPKTAARHLGKRYIIGTDHDRSLATATRLIVKEAP